MAWRFQLTKLNHEPVAEVINATERKYSANLSKPSTAGFNVRKDNPLLPFLFEDESKLLQVWDGNTLRMWGPIISGKYSAGEDGAPTVAVSAADAGWFFSRRLAGKSEKGTTLSGDKATAANTMISTTNAEVATGVATGTDTCGSSGTYVAGPYKPLLQCINELAHGIDGFDWYVEPLLGDATNIGKFRAAAVVGSEKPDVIFEHGTGARNMRSVEFLRDISTEVNQAYNISDAGLEVSAENPTPVVSAKDAANIASRGLFEELVDLSGVNNVTLRTEWAEENVRVRKNPRQVLGFTSDIDDGTGRVPVFGTDYWLGDRVQARAVVEGNILFNGLTRIYSVQVELNDAGTARVTPIVVDEGE